MNLKNVCDSEKNVCDSENKKIVKNSLFLKFRGGKYPPPSPMTSLTNTHDTLVETRIVETIVGTDIQAEGFRTSGLCK